MFEELTTELSTTLSVGSLLFFVVVYGVVMVRAFRRNADDLDARARMALDDEADGPHRGHAAVRG